MKCLALEKAFAEKNMKFEFLEAGKYRFSPDSLNNEELFVCYNRQAKYSSLTWDFIYPGRIDRFEPADIYRWCNLHNGDSSCCGCTYYLDDKNLLHAKFCTILPEAEAEQLEVCRKDLDYFNFLNIIVLMVVFKELSKPEPFSLKPLTEYDKMIMKKAIKFEQVVEMPSPEENMSNMRQQLQAELNELKMAVAAKEISAEDAAGKIKELEDLISMFNK